MKTNAIILGLYSPSYNARNVDRISGHYMGDLETRQLATYTIADGIATITELTPVYGTQRLNLPMPFTLPVNDLGSGLLQRIDINADTLIAQQAICPSQKWADRRAMRTLPTIPQTLMADYIGLL